MEKSVASARFRLLGLWLSQVARAIADNCLRMLVVLTIAGRGGWARDAAWHAVTPFFIVPFILLAPLDGAISNSLPKRWVLVGSSGWCLLVPIVALGLICQESFPWLCLAVVGLNALGAAIYSPTRYALLPAATRDTQQPLSRVVGWIEMGGAAGIVTGLLLGWCVHERWDWSVQEGPEPSHSRSHAAVVAAVAGLNLLALMAALGARFPSDFRRPERPGQAIAGFFRDGKRILNDPVARSTLLGLATFIGILMAGSGALVAYTLSPAFAFQKETLPRCMLLLSAGAALGSLLAGIQGHPRRSLGLVPLALTGLLLALAWATVSDDVNGPCLLLGVMGGIVNVPLRAAYQGAVPADARGNGMAIMNTANYSCGTLLAVLLFGLARWNVLTAAGQLVFLSCLTIIGLLIAWRVLLRDTLEQLVELIIWPFYRIRGYGPGLSEIPTDGPLLVVANHTAWFDPIWLAKVLPRRLTPMMTSRFYDLPVLRWIMRRLVHAIRVQANKLNRDPPEIDEAVAALDRGQCIVVFPEGFMRRKDEAPLRQFGQGIWRILTRRPQTSVVVCWIEGGWGSYFSYKNGQPTVNKRMDWWRRIAIGVDRPCVLGPQVLADQRATRSFLMRACLEARRHLGRLPLACVERADEPVER
jgi:1-acyl-sn-glycerol-3-phosphate acyltransferase